MNTVNKMISRKKYFKKAPNLHITFGLWVETFTLSILLSWNMQINYQIKLAKKCHQAKYTGDPSEKQWSRKYKVA